MLSKEKVKFNDLSYFLKVLVIFYTIEVAFSFIVFLVTFILLLGGNL